MLQILTRATMIRGPLLPPSPRPKSVGSSEKRGKEDETYSPFDTNHPASTKNLTIASDDTCCLARVSKPDSEAVDDIDIGFWFRGRSERLEVLDRRRISVRRVPKHDHIADWCGGYQVAARRTGS